MINFQTLQPSMVMRWSMLFDIIGNADSICNRPPAHYRIGKCHYILPYGAPKPVPLQYNKRKQRYTNVSNPEATALAYMKWKHPKDKILREKCSCDLKILKCNDTGRPRYIRFFYDRIDRDKKRRIKASVKYYDIEIPHWDFNPNILEEYHEA